MTRYEGSARLPQRESSLERGLTAPRIISGLRMDKYTKMLDSHELIINFSVFVYNREEAPGLRYISLPRERPAVVDTPLYKFTY